VRDVWCNLCGRKIQGHGTTRVLRKLVFNFDARCWRRKKICEALMRGVAGTSPDPIVRGAAEARAQEAPVAAGALPESLERFLAEMGEEVDAA
jgi:hypothetical protein